MSEFFGDCRGGCHDGVIPVIQEGRVEYKSVTCGGGSASCYIARLYSPLDAEERDFHPPRLQDATREINEILEDVMNDDDAPEGLHLSFISVPGGMMLNWTSYGELPRNAITLGKNSPEERLMAYGLIPSGDGDISQEETQS